MTAFVVVGAAGCGLGVLWCVYGPTGDGRPGPSPAVMGRIEPLRVEGQAVVMEVQTQVALGPAELRVAFDGPSPDAREMAEIERMRFGGLRERLPATGVWPGIPAGNQPWHLESVGSNLWQVAFLFPSAAAAQETFRGLGPREFGPIGLGDDDAVELFDTIASDGGRYRARLSAGRPVTSARPGFVRVVGRTTFEGGTIRVGWELSASGPCQVSTKAGGDEVSRVLPRVPFRLEGSDLDVALVLLAPDRFRLELQFLGTRSVEEIEGDADEAAKELLGSALLAGQGRFGDEFELCRVGGRPVRLKVARAGK